MSKSDRAGIVPVPLTAWEGSWIEGGCLYLGFWAGPQLHIVQMGPCRGYEGIELMKRALASGQIMPLATKPGTKQGH